MQENHLTKSTGLEFLDSDPHWRKRKIKEAIFIDCLNPNAEISSSSKIMNLEKGMEVSNCWKEFNVQRSSKDFFKEIGNPAEFTQIHHFAQPGTLNHCYA